MTTTIGPGMELRQRLADPRLLRTGSHIGGDWSDSHGGRTFEVRNPADNSLLAVVADCGPDEARRAISAAEAAGHNWGTWTVSERAAALRRWYELIIQHEADLATILTAEQGKPYTESLGEVRFGASYVEWYAEEAKRVYGDVVPTDQPDSRIFIIRQPVGVVVAITPWNFPSAMVARKCAPALGAGCTVVIKPAEQTPLSALALVVLAERAGFPPGVLNILPTNSPGPLGKVFTDSPIVRMLTFTGSTEVGRHLMRESASTVKKVALELGGNAPFIVFNDADIDKAVHGAMASKFRASGQTCVCANRIFVQSGVYDEFANRLAEKVRALVLGDGFTDEVEIGPLIDGSAVAKVKAHVEQAIESGAVCLVGGKQSVLGGHYFEPTVLTEVTTDMTVARDETFGPVAPLLRFESEGEVVAAANASEYGLAANLFTQDIGTAWRVAERLEYGTVGINTGSMSSAIAPAGGMKQSGIGREGSRYGIDEFVELKYLRLAGIMPARI